METQDQAYEKAKKRVGEIKDFWGHVAIFVGVTTFLTIIDLIGGDGLDWVYWVYFGWGIGVLIHAFSVYGTDNFFGKEWEERKIQELMAKDLPEKPKRGIDA